MEINHHGITTDIPHSEISEQHGGNEKIYTKSEAHRIRLSIFDKIAKTEYQADPSRHEVLYEQSRIMGKLVNQQHYEYDDAYDWLWSACEMWPDNRNPKKDAETIHDALQRGIRA